MKTHSYVKYRINTGEPKKRIFGVKLTALPVGAIHCEEYHTRRHCMKEYGKQHPEVPLQLEFHRQTD